MSADSPNTTAATSVPSTEAQAPPQKKRKKHHKAVDEWMRIDDGLQAAVTDLNRAVEKGLKVWRRQVDKSQAKRKNGAVKDALRNWTRACTRSAETAIRAPEDFIDAWDPKLKRLKKLYK
jgi:hypothetical protein